ncbi:hypothetical protein fugu_005146 [Takifugu bimaculatus]|uniref:MICOS complex subunit MIC10 n=1 Tax=Takifugu bimaculatus TaxID=433685 RepID=A0A4Z2B9M7_9TELE|nr:hypothetical protein fugu_005146 [Takifugu bimaculatus]
MADVQGRKWDRCLADTAVKTVTGLGVGIVFSILCFKRRIWPVSLGSGLGLGMGYANCQHELSSPYRVHMLKSGFTGLRQRARLMSICLTSMIDHLRAALRTFDEKGGIVCVNVHTSAHFSCPLVKQNLWNAEECHFWTGARSYYKQRSYKRILRCPGHEQRGGPVRADGFRDEIALFNRPHLPILLSRTHGSFSFRMM